jgi:8-oxo-dGTP pyrophosphatase MutT (NUDIX family)
MIRKVQVIVYADQPDVEVLLLKRPPERGSLWQPVTGKVEPEDIDTLAAARRELLEETGIHAVRALEDLDCEFRFSKKGIPVRERLVAARVDAPMPVTLSAEHVDFAWLGPDTARERLEWAIHRQGLARLIRRIRKTPKG